MQRGFITWAFLLGVLQGSLQADSIWRRDWEQLGHNVNITDVNLDGGPVGAVDRGIQDLEVINGAPRVFNHADVGGFDIISTNQSELFEIVVYIGSAQYAEDTAYTLDYVIGTGASTNRIGNWYAVFGTWNGSSFSELPGVDSGISSNSTGSLSLGELENFQDSNNFQRVFGYDAGGRHLQLTADPTAAVVGQTIAIKFGISESSLFAGFSDMALTAAMTVDTLADEHHSPAGTNRSLREAVRDIQEGGTIVFDPSLSGGTIQLTNQIQFNTSCTVDGFALDDAITIRPAPETRGFRFLNVTCIVRRVNISGGNKTSNTDVGMAFSCNSSDVTMEFCEFSGNTNNAGGGAVGIFASKVTFKSCLLAHNTSTAGRGGALHLLGALQTTSNQVVFQSCTLTENHAAQGGAVGDDALAVGLAEHDLRFEYCTVVSNTSNSGGSQLDLDDTICRTEGSIIKGSIVLTADAELNSEGYNIEFNTGQSGSFTNSLDLTTDIALSPLEDHGGFMRSIKPIPFLNLALNNGNPVFASGPADSDQRGFSRIASTQVDRGAYERIFVDSPADDPSLPFADTLREAIINARRTPAPNDLITFSPAVFNGEPADTILLTNGQLELNTSLSIDASDLLSDVTIDGGGTNRIFRITPDAVVVIDSLVLTNASSDILALDFSEFGGAVRNEGRLTCTACRFAGSTAYAGGGIYNATGGMLQVHRSTFSDNMAGNDGGGLSSDGALTLSDSSFYRNTAGFGGGLSVYGGAAHVHQCTFSENSSTNLGGGVMVSAGGSLSISHGTISRNSALVQGGGVTAHGSVIFSNVIVAGNTAPADADVDELGSPTAVGINVIGGDPRLAPLGDYGGPTMTMPPLCRSPAIDAATASAFTNDQRGFARPSGSAPDIGAVELQQMVVDTAADEDDGTDVNNVSLRDAVTNSTAELIRFDTSVFPATIVLTNGEIVIDRFVGINGEAVGGDVMIDGNDATRIFRIESGEVSMCDLVLTNAFGNGVNGGAIILEAGRLTADRLLITGNRAGNYGGGIYNDGDLTLNQSALIGNRAECRGGGIFNAGEFAVNQSTFNHCTLSGNFADRSGGGIYNFGDLTLNQCTLSGNSANSGGGISSGRDLTLNQCTLSGNSANSGGGIEISSTDVRLNQSTVSGNSEGVSIGALGTLYVSNSVVAGNPTSNSDNNIGGSPTANFYGQNLTAGNPRLAPLGDYGGPTQTMPPIPGSPAIDAATSGSPFTNDQRGLSRPLNGTPDIGAVEFQGQADIDLFAPLDFDGDGIPNGYEFDNGLDALTNDANDNLDLDPNSNIEEYIADTLASDSNSYWAVTNIAMNSPIGVSFDSSSNRVYSLQYNEQLPTGSWENVTGQTNLPGTGASMTLTDTNTPQPAARSYRVNVGLP